MGCRHLSRRETLCVLILLISIASSSYQTQAIKSTLRNQSDKHNNLDNIKTVTFLYNPLAGAIICNNSLILNSGEEYPFQDNTSLHCYASANNGYKFFAWENATKISTSVAVYPIYSRNPELTFTVTEDKIWNIDFAEKGVFELVTTYLFYKLPHFPVILFVFLLGIIFLSLTLIFNIYSITVSRSFFSWLSFRSYERNLKKLKQEYIHSKEKDRFLEMSRKLGIKIRISYEEDRLSDFHYTVLNEQISDNEKIVFTDD
jgi:hypothetical protein